MREICAHSGDMREKYAICLICCNMWENMRYAHLAKICGPEECAPHSRNRNCRNRECWNRNLYPPNYFSSPGPQTDTTTLQLVMRTDMTVYNIHQLQQRVPQQHHSRPLNTTVVDYKYVKICSVTTKTVHTTTCNNCSFWFRLVRYSKRNNILFWHMVIDAIQQQHKGQLPVYKHHRSRKVPLFILTITLANMGLF